MLPIQIAINVSVLFSTGLRFAKVVLFLSIGLVFLGESAVAADITHQELKRKLESGEKVNLVDVRGPNEYKDFNLGGILIPLGELPYRLDDLDGQRDQEVIVMCSSGARSARAQQLLEENGFTNVRNLLGGILAWQGSYGSDTSFIKSPSESTRATRSSKPKAPEPPKFVKIYVGNLAEATTEEDLRNAFAEYGEVKSVKIVKDKAGKQVGYIEMPASGADAAIEALNEGELDGNALEVKKAEPDKRQ